MHDTERTGGLHDEPEDSGIEEEEFKVETETERKARDVDESRCRASRWLA